MSEDWSRYGSFLKDADRDDRVGDHTAMVIAVEERTWPSGDPFKKVVIELLTANRAKADFNIQPLPTEEEMADSKNWETAKKRGVAQGINILKSLDQFYELTADTLSVGTVLRVKIVKNKEGFCRVAAILDPKLAAATKSDTSKVPF